jgi:hypothetical protein
MMKKIELLEMALSGRPKWSFFRYLIFSTFFKWSKNLPYYELPKCVINIWISRFFCYYFVWYDIHNIYAFSVLKGVLSMVLHMQWVHHPSVFTLCTWKHMDTHTPRGCVDTGVPTLVHQFMSRLSFQGFEVVLTFFWHMQWEKSHFDPTLGTLIHSLYHTTWGVWILVYPHWYNSSCLGYLSRVLRWC